MVELCTEALNIRHALSIHEEEQMNSEEQSATLQRRILDANKHWRPFMSDMHLREEKLTFVPQSPQTSVETSNEITDTFENITK
jgi:ribosomal protein S15P/S13E